MYNKAKMSENNAPNDENMDNIASLSRSSQAMKNIRGSLNADDGGKEGDINNQDDEEVWRSHIPNNFYYDFSSIVAKPHMSPDSGLPENLVTLYHSFGCDTFRRDNLKILNSENVGFIVGNYFEIRNLVTGERSFIRSIGGLGISSVDIHPAGTYIAIAEKGDVPSVCIYEYPSLKLFRILRKGTQRAYPSCQFT